MPRSFSASVSSTIYRLGNRGDIELIRIGQRITRVTQFSLDRFIKTAEETVSGTMLGRRKLRKGSRAFCARQSLGLNP